MTKEFFLRFYGQTDEAVALCIKEMQAAKAYVPKEYKIEVGAVSMNASVRPSHEVTFTFPDKATMARALASRTLRDIYMRYASARKQGDFNKHHPGQTAFSH